MKTVHYPSEFVSLIAKKNEMGWNLEEGKQKDEKVLPQQLIA